MKLTREFITGLNRLYPSKSRKECAELAGRILAIPLVILMWLACFAFCGGMLWLFLKFADHML